MENLKGRIRASRVNSNKRDDYINIYIEDYDSHTEFVTIELTIEQFGNLVSGRGTDCLIETKNLENVGKKREQKEEICSLWKVEDKRNKIYDSKEREIEAYEVLKEKEVDGWRMNKYSLQNGKNFYSEDGYVKIRVNFWRYADK